jgi:hypothetical protein
MKRKINPELSKGDRVKLIEMNGETSLIYGDTGTVTGKSIVFGEVQYGIAWDNGSNLQLLSDADKWMFEDDFNQLFGVKINENRDQNIIRRLEFIKHFNHTFLVKFLKKLRETSITNMMASAPYLYMGSDRIKNELKYKEVSNEEALEGMLDMSDRAQAEMINGVISYLEEKGIDPDLPQINRYLRKFSNEFVGHYIDVLS